MVIWLFAGGGEAEVSGLIPFLEKHFACTFERKTPIRRKPGPKPNRVGYGATGKSLVQQIQERLAMALRYSAECDLILIVDDLDCRDAEDQKQRFLAAIDAISEAQDIERFVAFAAPEIEAWLIADWDNTLARHVDFRAYAPAMQHWLSHEHQVPFDQPETFSYYEPERDACAEKLSALLIEASYQFTSQTYSKSTVTPLLLHQYTEPDIVSQKCPLFRQMYTYLTNVCEYT